MWESSRDFAWESIRSSMVRKKRQRKQVSCFDKNRDGSAYRTDLETSVVMFWEICETLSPLLEVVDNLEAEDREMRDNMRERTNMGNLNLRESFGLPLPIRLYIHYI